MAESFAEKTEFTPLETPQQSNKLESITALARFEFEPGKGNDGTKILMVEWGDHDLAKSSVGSGSWHVSWDRKKTVLPTDEQANDQTRRCYFLLPPGTTIPPLITLTYEPSPSSATTVKELDPIRVNPLPAIFPPELGTTARSAGKKGVLHTIWAKKRLQGLEKEIKAESASNPEAVALVMALQEREWIESNFGVSTRPATSLQTSTASPVPTSPITTPISPTGGKKLTDKLKGLSLRTTEAELSTKNTGTTHTDPNAHPLSPDEPDVAISSFSSFHNTAPTHQPPRNEIDQPTAKQPVAHHPPDHLRQQQEAPPGFASLSMKPRSEGKAESGDDLFAKALSPRSPDIPRSPFSFSSEETKQDKQRINAS